MEYKDLFHIHTSRCGHAGNETDEAYISTAINLGANSIYFTDHAPFPNNVFGNRMQMEELNEYIVSMKSYKEKYDGIINVKFGLEIEYIPKYRDYYKFLKDNYNINLFLGQHICQWKDKYNFEYTNKTEEFIWFTESIEEAASTGLFSGIFHPERIYKNVNKWNDSHDKNSLQLWNLFREYNMPVEYNFSSNETKRRNFWKFKNTEHLLYGLDAHSVQTLIDGTRYFEKL